MFFTKINKLYLLVILTVVWKESNSARILVAAPSEMYSHYHLTDCLLRGLANRGHNITLISPFTHKTPIPNYRNIHVTSNSTANKPKISYFQLGQKSLFEHMVVIANGAFKMTENVLEHTAVQQLLNDSNEKFDLVIITLFQTEALYGLAHKYDTPVIVFSTFASGVWSNHLVGNPAPRSYVPDIHTSYSGIMTIIERIYNAFFSLCHEAYRRYIHFPKVENTLHKHFPDAPSIYELMYNRTAMVLMNTHPTITLPIPLVPALVEVGGFHIQEPKPLPHDLQQLMDNAPHGVILFSLGSSVRATDLSNETRKQLMNAFSKLQQIVIWKFEDDNLPGTPDNVKIMKWCPQNDIIGHPNLKLFITQGGILSIMEAVYHSVPIIGIPIFADQKMNMATIAQRGYGLNIPFKQLTDEVLFNAIEEVTTNPMYKNNIQRASKIFRNQLVKPLDSAVFWVEHVLEHRGAKHFRVNAMDLTWFQLYSVDIICILISIILLLSVLFIYIKNCTTRILVKIITFKKKTE